MRIRLNPPLLAKLALGLLCLSAAAHAAGLSAQEVMTRNEEARKIDDVTSSATLVTGGGGAAEKTKSFTWWRKLTADKARFNTLTRFHAPAEVRGEGILFLEHENDQNDVQMYLPAFKKVRRVESQQQSGSFMGSEFSYADIATPHVTDYKQKMLRQEDCAIDGGAKARCYVIESTPATDAVRDRTGYSKTIQWVRPDNFMAVKAEFYDKDGALWKRMAATDVKEVDPARHKWMSLHVRIENAKNGRYTDLKFAGVKVNTGVADSVFTVQNLSRER